MTSSWVGAVTRQPFGSSGQIERTLGATARWPCCGDWGTLIVLTTMPRIPIDNDLVVALSIGLPVGLGTYLAWVHRTATRRPRARVLDSRAAVAGALAGAWLGFHATTGLIALVTAILGAIAGANLVLILLDRRGLGRSQRPGGVRRPAGPCTVGC